MSDHYKILGQSSTTVTSGVLTLYEVPSPSASDSYGPTVSPKAVSLLTRALVSTIVVVNTNGTIGTIDIGIVGNRIPGLTSIFDGLDFAAWESRVFDLGITLSYGDKLTIASTQDYDWTCTGIETTSGTGPGS
jgi:hypothetical protein|tara:strand:- start:1172 stop:1570 length:399 start_codon:yes stop_codon:yes gene_type:complete